MDKNTFISILFLGLYKYSEAIEIEPEEAIKDAVYCYHHDRENLPEVLASVVSDYTDDYYRGFNSSGEYVAEEEIEAILPVLEENPDLYESLKGWYKLRKTCGVFGIRTRIQNILDLVKKNQDTYNSKIFFQVNADMIKARAIEPDRTKPDQRAKLAMYLGILSIVGENDYFRASSELIKCIMFGCKDKDELDIALQDESFKATYDKYTTRRKYDRYLRELQEDGAITKFGIKNSTYLSVTLSLAELEARIEREYERNKPKTKGIPREELIANYI